MALLCVALLVFFSFLPRSRPYPSTRPRRRPFAHEPGIRLVCALITLLGSPSSLATLEINGGLPIVIASYMGREGCRTISSLAPTNVRFFFPNSGTHNLREHRSSMSSPQKKTWTLKFLARSDLMLRIRFIEGL